MAKERKVMCTYCKEKYYRSELIEVNKSNRACSKCNETRVKEAEEFKALIDYICKGFMQNAPTGQQLKDIQRFKALGYTYSQIQWTIYYIACVLKKNMNKRLGLVPYYYQEAKTHFEQIERVNNSMKDVEIQDREITITVPHVRRKSTLQKTRYVNIEEL